MTRVHVFNHVNFPPATTPSQQKNTNSPATTPGFAPQNKDSSPAATCAVVSPPTSPSNRVGSELEELPPRTSLLVYAVTCAWLFQASFSSHETYPLKLITIINKPPYLERRRLHHARPTCVRQALWPKTLVTAFQSTKRPYDIVDDSHSIPI